MANDNDLLPDDDWEEEKSKTQVKKEMTDLQAFGESLAELRPEQQAKIPMSDSLREAIDLLI